MKRLWHFSDREFYNETKEVLRKVQKDLKEGNHTPFLPVVVVSFEDYRSYYFENEMDACEWLQKVEWDESPPEGEIDDYVIFKYAFEDEVVKYPKVYKKYKPYKAINGQLVFRSKSHPTFEPEMIVNVSI